MNKSRGFTLIELLAVIVILGILLAISTVAVNSIRKKQAAENRRNTISGVLSGARMYASDKDILSDLSTSNGISISVKDIVDGNYTDLDTDQYEDIYESNVSVSVCTTNTNVKYSYKDGDITYNDCGCSSQEMKTSSELCEE